MREKPDYLDEIIFDDQSGDVVWKYDPTVIVDENQVMQETSVATLGEFAMCVNNWANPSKAVKVNSEVNIVRFKSTTKSDGELV